MVGLGGANVVRVAALPLAVGALIMAARPDVGVGSISLLSAGFVLGCVRPAFVFSQGALVMAPVTVTAAVAGFADSWQLGVLVLVAAPFAAGLAGLAAAAGAMIRLGDRRRRRAAVLIGVVAVGALVAVSAHNAGERRIEDEASDLRKSVPAALAEISGIDLMTGAYSDAWSDLADDVGTRPFVMAGPSQVDLRFDLTPAVAPWLTRCLVATVADIDETLISSEAVSFSLLKESC